MSTTYNSNFNGTMPFTDQSITFALTQTVVESFTIPGPSTVSYTAIFHFPIISPVWVGLNVVPHDPVTGSPEIQPFVSLRPEKKYVRGGDVINLLVNEDIFALTRVSVELYVIPGN